MSIKVVLRVEYQLKHSQDPLTKEEIVNTKVTYCKKNDSHVKDNNKTPPILYWLPKMH